MTEYVVLLDSGGKQDFIFASNKQIVNIGASHLIAQVGTSWVREAIQEVTDGRATVGWRVLSSGKAVLVVPDRETGTTIVRAVTLKALEAAPGLEVSGVVQEFTEALGPAVNEAHKTHALVRATLPSPKLRRLTLPYSQPCQYSALPAVTRGPEGNENFPRASSIDAAWKAGRDGRERMVKDLDPDDAGLISRAVLAARRLGEGVENQGWIAVVHADGNGIGAIFGALGRIEEDAAYQRLYEEFSSRLDSITRAALRTAVVNARYRTRTGQPQDWILPIVVGGDDVTAIMDARLAFQTVRTFLEEFEALGSSDKVTELLTEMWTSSGGAGSPPKLTASAGIAYVKPHHPFSDAYRLAEELCVSAKTLKALNGGHSVLDFHVLHDSIGRSLRDLRADQLVAGANGSPLRMWAGPFLVGGDTGDPRHVSWLDAAIDAQRRTPPAAPLLPSGSVHRLRTALLRGGEAIKRECAQVRAWHDDKVALDAYFQRHLTVTAEPVPDGGDAVNTPCTRIIDALHLLDMEIGTVGHPDETELLTDTIAEGGSR